MDILSEGLVEPVAPDIKIYDYTNGIYKIIRFKSTAPRLGPHIDKDKPKSDIKLDAALSRARKTVLELGLCNEWKYFCTFTLDHKKFDRYNLDEFHKKFSQWIKDQRKKYNISIDYLLVPEPHKDGAWHMHGLFSDISPLLVSFRTLASQGRHVPVQLLQGDFYNWLDYEKKFGFCSFGLIKNNVAVSFYISKYITKSLAHHSVAVGSHLYYPSRGLRRSSLHGEIYGNCQPVEKFLVNHYEFCSTGFTHCKDQLDWSFALEYMEVLSFDTIKESFASDPEIVSFESVSQLLIEGFS